MDDRSRAGPGAAPGVGFVVPDLGRTSGGGVYNAEVARAWPRGAPPLSVHPVRLDAAAAAEIGSRATGADVATALGRHRVSIVDGLLGSEHPDAIAAAQAAGRRVLLLVHMCRPDDPALDARARERAARLEARAVREAWGVVSPSAHAAADLAGRYGRRDTLVAKPGTHPAPVAAAHATPCILQLGAIGPLKNQELVLAAAERVRDEPFRLRQIGPAVDDATLARLRERAGHLAEHTDGPEPPLSGAALDAAYAAADLLVSVSTRETYGLVITEALARGIPAIVGRGTGAEEALSAGSPAHAEPPGTAVATDDPAELAAALRAWLCDAELRATWRARALDARDRLVPWASTARVIADRCAAALDAVADLRT